MAHRRFERQKHTKVTWGFNISRGKVIRWGLIVLAVGLLFGGATVLWWSRDLPDPQNINQGRISESTKIYDTSGQNLLYEIGDAKRTQVPLNKISSYITQATLAAEDDQFYNHHGIDIKGTIRAILVDIIHLGSVQGGSTITQQLIKASFLTPEKSLQRKVKEAVLAVELEQKFSKDQIFEMYLNAIPYGSRAYGVEAAAQTFFNTSAANVDLAQAAILAALPQAPSYFSPYGSHIEDLKARQEYILNRMATLNMITKDQATAAKQEHVTFQPAHESIRAPHFVFYVKELLDNEFGERVVDEGGLKVITTLDMRLQTIAEDILKKQQDRLKKLGASNAALVAIDPKNGNILAMAGSIDYFDESIDGNVNVAVRYRSPGSSIKPFVYTAAFLKGYTPDTVLVDALTDFGQGYTPKNYNLKENGPVTMRQALANSLNIPAVETLYLAGVKQATKLAHDMGMESLTDPDRYGLSLVLGGGEVRLLDETSAYGVFANDGLRFPSRAVLKVDDKDKTLFDAGQEQVTGQQIIPEQIARLTTSVMSDNNARGLIFGTNSPLQLGARPVAAKTGTAQDFRDGWTMGFTPSLAVGVWTGNNNNTPMRDHSDGVVTAGPIWNSFMKQALEGTPIEQFVAPEPITNQPYGYLRNEIPEVKGKWVPETNTLYTLDCPINVGQVRTFKELHSILYYVRRDTPTGPPPDRAESDPQFDNWETGVAAWRDKHNADVKDKPDEPIYVDTLPVPSCNVGNSEDIPKIKIIAPDTTILHDSPVTIQAEVDSPSSIKEVRFLLDGKQIASRGPSDSYTASFSFAPTDIGRRTLQILAITNDNLIGQAHRTFIINPDSTPPAISLLAPKNNTTLHDSDFPYTVKTSASDPSGIDNVDILYRKEGQSGTGRIGKTSTVAATAANRYEVKWNDSPGPGTYTIYAIAYDKTGNFNQSSEATITIE